MRFRIRRPRHATIVAYMALFVALGGTSYALTVRSEHIPKNELTGKDIKNLRPADFKGGDVPNQVEDVVADHPTGLPANGSAASTAQCPPGFAATGGGWIGTTEIKGSVVNSYPSAAVGGGPEGWTILATGSGQAATFQAFAVCITD
jgi:hypothetical protein